MIHAAAIRHMVDGTIYTLPRPKRHPDIIWHIDQTRPGGFKHCDMTQGFLTHEGVFLNRIDAGIHALACGQIPKLHVLPQLYTEDLW